jgi:hypothetical protein
LTAARNKPGRPERPSDNFDTWPESAQEAYLLQKEATRAARRERDELRAKAGEILAPVSQELAAERMEDLTLPWTEWMDGKVHRLKRGKHFDGEVGAVLEEARLAARLAGRGVLAMRELMGPKYQYLWFQFTDHVVYAGDPCPCGGRKLTRVHPSLARCRRCGKTLLLNPR